jgi:hypothetical protein
VLSNSHSLKRLPSAYLPRLSRRDNHTLVNLAATSLAMPAPMALETWGNTCVSSVYGQRSHPLFGRRPSHQWPGRRPAIPLRHVRMSFFPYLALIDYGSRCPESAADAFDLWHHCAHKEPTARGVGFPYGPCSSAISTMRLDAGHSPASAKRMELPKETEDQGATKTSRADGPSLTVKAVALVAVSKTAAQLEQETASTADKAARRQRARACRTQKSAGHVGVCCRAGRSVKVAQALGVDDACRNALLGRNRRNDLVGTNQAGVQAVRVHLEAKQFAYLVFKGSFSPRMESRKILPRARHQRVAVRQDPRHI